MLHLVSLYFLLSISTTYSTLYSHSSNVIPLSPSNFNQMVLKSDSVWLVEFYAPWCGHCQNLVPEYEKTANYLKGVAKVGAVNADDHKELAKKYGVKSFPTIKIFVGENVEPKSYQGGRTAKDMSNAVMDAIKTTVNRRMGTSGGDGKSDVITLTDSNFEKLVLDSDDLWLVEFFAPWCGHCKNLAPHWEKAATELKGKVKLGALDATEHQGMAARFNVQGYPTIKFFPAGKKTSSMAVDYEGGRTSSDIVNWANEKVAENVPAPEVEQVVSEEVFSQCSGKPLCVVSVLPHILDCDAACRNDYLTTLKKVGDKFKNKMWGWVWSEAGAQMNLENALELGGFGYPAMAVLNSKKLKFSTLRGSFSVEGISEFLRDLSYGRGNTSPVRSGELPKIENIELWDGKDGQLPTEEDYEKDEL